VDDEKYFVIAKVERGKTRWTGASLKTPGRLWIALCACDRRCSYRATAHRSTFIRGPHRRNRAPGDRISRDWETLIDEAALREYTAECFEFHLVRRPQSETAFVFPEIMRLAA